MSGAVSGLEPAAQESSDTAVRAARAARVALGPRLVELLADREAPLEAHDSLVGAPCVDEEPAHVVQRVVLEDPVARRARVVERLAEVRLGSDGLVRVVLGGREHEERPAQGLAPAGVPGDVDRRTRKRDGLLLPSCDGECLGDVDGRVEHRSAGTVVGRGLDGGGKLGASGIEGGIVLFRRPREPSEVRLPDDESRPTHGSTVPTGRAPSAVRRRAQRWAVSVPRHTAYARRGGLRRRWCAPREEDAGLGVVADRARQDPSLDVAADGDEPLRRLGVGDADDVLLDDRALVEVGRHVVRRGPDELDTAVVRLVVGLGALEARQERVVDVDGPALERAAQVVAEDLHVAGQHDEADAAPRRDGAAGPRRRPWCPCVTGMTVKGRP